MKKGTLSSFLSMRRREEQCPHIGLNESIKNMKWVCDQCWLVVFWGFVNFQHTTIKSNGNLKLMS